MNHKEMADLVAFCRAIPHVETRPGQPTDTAVELSNYRINWSLLALQKAVLIELVEGHGDNPLRGLIELLDSIQEDGDAQGLNVVYAFHEV